MRPRSPTPTIWKAALLMCAVFGASACERSASLVWTWSGAGPSRSGLLAVPDGVVFGNEAGAVVRLNQDGRSVWTTQVGREVAARPTVVGEHVVAASIGGDWVGLRLSTGAEVWRVSGKPPLTLALASDPQRAYAVTDDGSVMAITGTSGGTVWKRLPPKLRTPVSVTTPPVLLGGRLIVGLGAAGLLALRPEDGDTLWRRDVGGLIGFLAEGERIYTTSSDRRVHALDAKDGSTEWARAVDLPIVGGPWLARGLLWVALEDAGLAAIDPQDGAVTWQTKLPAPVTGGVEAYRELVLVPTSGREGRLLGFRPGQDAPVVNARMDNALRTSPLVLDERVLIQASDGRVLAWEIQRTTR